VSLSLPYLILETRGLLIILRILLESLLKSLTDIENSESLNQRRSDLLHLLLLSLLILVV
jgi:hypothetical protein